MFRDLLERPAPQYLTSPSGRMYFISILPAKNYQTLAVIEEPLARIRAVIDEVRGEFPGLDIGLTGKPVLQADEMSTTNRDTRKASIVAFVLVAVLFMIFMGHLAPHPRGDRLPAPWVDPGLATAVASSTC
jgi:hypothetical protein